nr:Chain D, Histone-lysine N-methyltransferase SETDB1 [Homo sapiens]8IYA_E Chain E, Histone-lysine N-methyltransferase SETDB1 [Homo sapiens]8IYA_F Chain F, Histone-lysine N-methyltransferase SETDB1 [Homo sapiens]
CEGYES